METLALKKPEETHFSISEHMEFHKVVRPMCFKYEYVIQAPDLLADYNIKVDQEETVYTWIRRSDFTRNKAETDNKRDITLTGLEGIVRVNLKNFNPAIRDNAFHVHNLLVSYGDLPRMGYDAETAGIDSLIARLRSPEYFPAATNLGIIPWIDELDALNNLFKSYVEDTTQEQIVKPQISPRIARRETDLALRLITNRTTSLINLNGAGAYVPFAEEFNTVVNHYNTLVHEHYGRIHAKIDITRASIAAIDIQDYIGKPIYVIPTVNLTVTNRDGSKTTVELVFSQDFSVAYKNNIEPGTATIIITGMGKYKGELVTTFNIAAKY
jgi:hypothetical protein